MSSWKEYLLGDLLQFQRGFDITTKEQQPGNIPVISSSGITSYHNKAMVQGPGVITGRKGSLGKAHFVQSNYWPHDTTLWIKDFKGNNPKFLYYLLQQIHLENYDVGASNPTLNRNHLHKIKLKCPPPPIQQKIAAILSAYDDLIENNNKRIALLEKAAEEIYREWFVRMRFPGWEQVKFVKGIPEGWETSPLRSVAQFNARSTRKGQDFDFINYVDISSVTTHRINSYERIPFSTAPGRARRIVKHGDIIWSTVRPVNRAFCLIFNPIENLIVSTGFAVITSKENMSYSFLYYAVTSNSFVEHIANMAKGAAYPAADVEDFKRTSILVPKQDLLREFHANIEPMFIQKNNIAKQNEKLKQSRDLLLPRLISGKLPVDDLDIRFPPSMKDEGGAVRVRAGGGGAG